VKIATWNVNGIRARESQLEEWIARERPEVLCLQEIKATPDQIPSLLCELQGYWCYYHGTRGYSGVALHVRKDQSASRPTFTHPEFDFESRIAAVELGGLTVASVYVPNGGKDLAAKMRFLEALAGYAADARAAGRTLVLAGDLNVARTEQDVHPSERKAGAIGQRPDERAALEKVIAQGLVDVARALAPQDDRLFTWWAPWRNLRQRNVGWRIDYLLASEGLAARASACVSQREFGTSDHAPLMATFGSEA
jgi:exodeoxyribonuclease-3